MLVTEYESQIHEQGQTLGSLDDSTAVIIDILADSGSQNIRVEHSFWHATLWQIQPFLNELHDLASDFSDGIFLHRVYHQVEAK